LESLETEPPEEKDVREREPRLAAGLIIAGLVFCLALGLWPQLHTAVTEQAAASYTFIELISP
jgi:hypothetical protein